MRRRRVQRSQVVLGLRIDVYAVLEKSLNDTAFLEAVLAS
jgi:hypothetical protein